MAGPWERYQQAPAPEASPGKPWEKYAPAAPPEAAPTQERYQVWPERLARAIAQGLMSGFTLPHDVMAGKTGATPETADIGRVLDLATMINPASVARGIGKVIVAARAPAETAPRAAMAQAFERSGVQPTLPMLTPNRGVNVTGQALRATFPGYPLERATQAAAPQAGKRVESLAEGLSPVAEGATAGERLQAGAQKFAEAADERMHALYNAPELKAMDPNVLSTMPNSRRMVTTLDAAIENPEIKALVTDSNLGELFNTIRSAGTQGVSFEDLQKLRTAVGQLQPAAGSKVGINKRATKALYSSLTKDIYGLAEEAGGDAAVRALKDADQYTNALKATRLPALKPIIDSASGENVFQTILRLAKERGGADWRRLAQIKRSVGAQDWKDIAAVIVRGLGHSGDIESPFSPKAFLKNYGDLSPRGKDLLFPKELRSALDDLETVSRGIMQGSTRGTVFGASKFVTPWAAFAGAMANLPLTAGLGAGMNVLARVMSNPKAVRWLAGASRATGKPEALKGWLRQIDTIAHGDKEMGDILRRLGATALYGRDQTPAGNPSVVGGGPLELTVYGDNRGRAGASP